MASDWQRYLATQMASYGVDPRLLQSQMPPAQAIPPPIPGGTVSGAQLPPGRLPIPPAPPEGRGRLTPEQAFRQGMQRAALEQQMLQGQPAPTPGRGMGAIQNQPTPRYKKAEEEPPEMTEDEKILVASLMSSGVPEDEAMTIMLEGRVEGMNPSFTGGDDLDFDRTFQEIKTGISNSSVGGVVGDIAPYVGVPIVADKPEDVNTQVTLGAPSKGSAAPMMLTPQEESQANQRALENDQWERIHKPMFQEAYPEVVLENEIARVEQELGTLDNTYTSSMLAEGGNDSIGGPVSDIEGAQSSLDEQRAAKELELQQLMAVRFALYGTPVDEPWAEEDKEDPWYQPAVNYGKDVLNGLLGIPGVGGALEIYDAPSEFMRQNMGGWMIRMASQGQLQPGMQLATGPIGIATGEMGRTLDPAEIERAYAEGGNAAVWEYAVGRYPELMGMSEIERAAFLGGLDAAFDPLNAVGAVAGATRGAGAIGRAAEAVDVAANLPGAAVLGGANLAGRAITNIPGVGGLFDPGATAITREVGNTADDIAPTLEAGSMMDIPPEPGASIGDTPITPAGPFSGEATLASPKAPPPAPPARPFYADETPFSDEDFAEYIQRTRAGEDPQVVVESIYARGEGGTPAPGGEASVTPTSPVPTREDPLADLTGLDSPGTSAAPEAPSRIVEEVPRPRYNDGTPYDEDDYQRYLANYGDEAQNDATIDLINGERDAAAAAPSPRAPEVTPTTPDRVDVAPEVVPTEVAPERPTFGDTPSRAPEAPRYQDDPEVMDIPVDLRGTGGSELRKYGLPGWYQTAKGAWKRWDGLSRVKGVRFNLPGEKAWRQRVRTLELDIENGVPINTDRLPSGAGLSDQETGTLMGRYIVEPDNKTAAKILNILGKSGKNSYIDDAGNRFVRKGNAQWQEADGGRQALNVVSQDGKKSAVIFKNQDNSYSIQQGGVEGQARIRALGGMGDPGQLPYVDELVERLKEARIKYQKGFDTPEEFVPTPKKGPSKFVPKPRKLGITGFSKRQQAALDGYSRWAQKITGNAPDSIPEIDEIDLDTLNMDRLSDRLARVGGIGKDHLDWLNTPINVDDIRLGNMTADQRKIAVQALGLEPGATDAKSIKELLDAAKASPTFQAPTRGEVYEQLLETMGDMTSDARLDLWKKTLGGVKPAIPGARQALREGGVPSAAYAVGRKGWAEMGAMVRSSILYQLPKLIYNTTQDAMTNHFVYMIDGQGGVSDLHARMMKDFANEAKLGQNIRKITGRTTDEAGDEVRRFASTTHQVNSIYTALDMPVPEQGFAPAIVGSQLGGKFDEDLGRLVENKETWWSDFGGRIGGRLGRTAGSLVASPSGKIIRSTNDDLMRRAGSADFILRNYNTQHDEFLDEIREIANRYGFDADEAITRLHRRADPVFGMHMFSSQDVMDVFRPYNAKQAEHLARRWRGRTNALRKGGIDNVKKMSFSYLPTRADEAVGKIWMFHYWMTRASAQHARLALENPQLMANYVRTWTGMENMEGKELLPAWARQYVSLMVGPFGMLGLVSPAAILTGLSVVLDVNGVLDDPSISGVLQSMPFHPIVQAAASVYLTERLPDPTGTNQTRQFAKAAVNYLRNDMGVGEAGLTKDYLSELTYNLQQIAREIAPGASSLSAPSPEQKDTQLVKYYAVDIMKKTPDPDGGTLWQNPDGSITEYASQVMANIDSGLYAGEIESQALEQYSTDTFMGRLAMTSLPITSLYPSVVGEARGLNAAAGDAQYAPIQLDTTTGPIGTGVGAEAYVDPSRAPTTMEMGGDLAVAQGDAGSPVSAALVADLNRYSNLGDDETKDTWSNANNYIYMSGEELRTKYGGTGFIINGEQFAWEIWDAIPEEARRTYMDSWMKSIGQYQTVMAYRSERDAFEEAHPQVAEFKRWQETVGENGGEAMLEMLMAGDKYPAFKAWWQTQDVKPADIEKKLMSPAAYLASIGHEPSLWDTNDISNKPTVNQEKESPLDTIAPKDTSNTGFTSDKPWDALTPEEKVVRLNEKLHVYAAEMVAFDRTIAPYTGGKPYGSLGPSGITILEAIMQKKGIVQPTMPSIVNDYITWMHAQPADADTSVNAYVASLADLEIAA